MPDEAVATTEPQKPLAVPMKEVIGNVFDGVFETPKPETPPKEAEKPAQPPEKAPEKEKPAPSGSNIPESVFADPEAPEKPEKTVIEKADELAKAGEQPIKDEIPPEVKGKAREHFKKLETKARELEEKLAKAEQDRTQGDTTAKARIDLLEKQLAQNSAVVERANLQLSERYQREISIPRKQALEFGKEAMKDAGADPDALEVAVGLKGTAKVNKLDEILGEVTSEFQKTKIKDAILAIERIDARDKQIQDNHKQWLTQVQQEEAANRHRSFTEYEKTVVANLDEALRLLGEEQKIIFFRKSSDPKNKDWNDQIDRNHAVAKDILLKVDDHKQMTVASELAAAFPMAYKAFLTERDARLKAEKRLKEYEDSEPELGGERTRSSSDDGKTDDMDFVQRVVTGVNRGRR